jgi:hypothetical protein
VVDFTIIWTLISNFAAQWLLWLIITQTGLWLWWHQVALQSRDMQYMIFTYMAVLNIIALVLREYLVTITACKWLQQYWTRFALVVSTLIIMWLLAAEVILSFERVYLFVKLGGGAAIVGHLIAFGIYRYKLPDIWAFSATVVSGGLICEVIICEIVFDRLSIIPRSSKLLLIAILTLIIFVLAVIFLQNVLKKLQASKG